jgi:acyl-CoA synthetase (AMP-forming)/AMP-acid ligase II
VLTLRDPLEHARRLYARRVAIVDGDLRLSFADLHDRAQRLGVLLRKLGLRAGDRVAFLSANSHRYLEAFFGVPIQGMLLVPLNTRLAEPELVSIVAHSGARVLFCDREPGALARSVERVIELGDEYERLLAGVSGSERNDLVAPHVDENTVAALFYTGGTTGLPKGVMLTHRNLVANAFHKTVACTLTGEDVFLAAPALFHVAGIAPLVGLTWLGARTVSLPSFDPEACLDAVERERVTIAIPVPTMIAALVAAQRARPRDVRSLRLLGHAGSPIASELIAEAHATFPESELAQFYGATETSSVVTSLRNEERVLNTALLGSCGRAVPGVAVKIARDDGSECADGEVGEIWVRGPNVTVGYWQNPEATDAALRDGWYRTGDLGQLRQDGYLFVVDRLKDMIVSGGENVYSIEVEDALARHPAVAEVAVFGVPHAQWGEAVHAVVVLRAGVALDGEVASVLRAHCRTLIAGYKVPKQIEIHHEPLPKSGPGKILKRLLRDRHRAHAHGAERKS